MAETGDLGETRAVTGAGWLGQRERGTPLALAFTLRMARLLGRQPMRVFVHTIALWYRVFDRGVTRASRDWLARIHGRPAGYWEVYRHLCVFAQVTLDRIFLLSGRTQDFVFTRTGNQHLMGQLATGRGAVLLGAHVGSYDAMRAAGFSENVPIKILGYFKNAQRINALLADLNPGQAAHVIHMGDDPVSATVRAQGCIEQGELVALLGDRVGLNARVVRARFLGEEADFPAGPFLLASLLRCPIYVVFGLYREPNRYDLHCEPFAERLELPRKTREESLRAVAQRYADRLEHYCRMAPDNWFNFFDFWSKP